MSAVVPDPNPRHSETEEEALALYDRLQELHIQIGLLQAQQDLSDPQRHFDIDEARTQLLEAKATVELRNYIFESAVVVRPVLRAIHGGTEASPVERSVFTVVRISISSSNIADVCIAKRDILPLIRQRDLISAEAAEQASASYQVRDHILDLELERLRVGQHNATLASELLRLSKTTGTHDVQVDGSTKLGRKLCKTKGELRVSRQKWKTIKGATNALVAGTGIDWARDERLRDLVLDPPGVFH
ncbi:centromere protein H (CENP-H)-domain-containing protein [Neurospora hispaniola]|uniref:Centromere protein H (CENP-H)-domain-containing protein n=1 Tax=Neurospora hispaniola TaxID=588809 RepID=A0AAJ0HYP1_9PEZI|nr:centromere protein H (CENP-H)-domain-containing protein [Neurospora hispaniola]